MEGPQRERGPAPSIATTPPRADRKEELLSQSSSGTQISIASGVSLGEVIRRRSAANWEMEEWYQPCTEVDASNLIVALGWMGQTPGAGDLSEFPTMEEGFVNPTETVGRHLAPNVTHSPILEIQDSCLSPKLPLLTTYSTQGQTFFNETVFQPAETDFAALRGTPDVSGPVSDEVFSHLQMREAVRLATMEVGSESSSDCLPLSQHPLAISTMTPSNTSLGGCLSQHPLSLSAHVLKEQKNCNEEETSQLRMCGKTFGSKDGISGVLSSQNLPNQQMATPLPPPESWGAFSGQDLFLLDSNVPAPLLLDILEEEVGLSKQYGFLSSGSSSGKSVLGKDPEENETSQQIEDVVLVEREPEIFLEPHQQEVVTISEFDPLKIFSDSERKLGNANGAAITSQVSFGRQRVGLSDSCSNTGVPSRPLQNKPQVQHVSDVVFEEQKRKLVSALADCRLNVALQPATMAAEHGNSGSDQVDAVVETQMGASKNELTLSDFTIEREYKDTGVSPSFNEGSFFGHLAHPIHHSTPGLFTTQNMRQEASGMTIPVKSVLQSPLSCLHEELSKNSSGDVCLPSVEEPRVLSGDDTGVPSSEEPLTLQSEQESKNESSGHLRVLHPVKGRIQSLPSLNFMEKVGAWNMNQSAEKMSDALALDGSSGISSRQKSYSAIAASLNSILLKHQKQFDLKPGLVTPFCGPKSITSVCSYDKKSPHTLPLTRSQSENSVMAISREMSKSEVGHEKIRDYDLQPAEDKGHVSGDSEVKQSEACRDVAEEPLIRHQTAVLVSTVSSDEETIEHVGSGKSTNPDNFITSERVAELLREETGSLSGCQEKSGGSPDNPRETSGIQLCTNGISMDRFRDVSPDSLNQLTSSGGGSCIDLRLSSGQSSRRSSAVSGKLQSSLEDVLQISDHGEMNIEERIPVYLHNLGIDQSPSSILTPFMPRGPVREIELSPTELRTLKASTDLLTQRRLLSEGNSVTEAMQSSFNSSIFSVPVPAGSHTGSDSPLPTERPSQPSGDLLRQSRTVCCQSQLCAPPQPLSEDTSESPAALQSAEQSNIIPEGPSNSPSEKETAPECVQALTDPNDSKELGISKEKPFCGSVTQENAEKRMIGETASLRVDSGKGRDDSFIGSETLKEIEKLLAETEIRTSGRKFNTSSLISSSTELGSSLKQMKNMDASIGSGPLKGSYPGIQRMWSWDETLNRQNVQKDNVCAETLSLSGGLKWEGFHAVDIGSQGQVVPEKLKPTCKAVAEENKRVKPITRSEPEGCNSVVVNKSLAVSGNNAAESNLDSSRDLKEFQATSSLKPSNTLENVQQVLEKSKGGSNKEMSSSHSSSVDSLGMKVKNLLRYEPPVLHSARWLDEQVCGESAQKQDSVGASLAGSKEEPGASQSNKSSSLDSLAARVKTLLEDERPVMHAIQILQSAEEEEAKVHASLKLKRAAQPAHSVPDLNEEDRRMIEQIKREQYLSARTTGLLKGQMWRTGRFSSPDSVSKLNPELSKSSSVNELEKAIHTQNFKPAEVPKVNIVQARPVYALQSEPETKSLNRIQIPVCNQLQTHTDNSLDPKQNVHVPLDSAIDTNLMELASASRALVGGKVKASAQLTVSNSSTEPAKQITSITFASRKRSYSPASCSGLHKATPGNLVPLEKQPFNNEQLKPSKPQQENLKPCALADTAAVHILDRSVGFSLGRGSDQDVSFGIKEESRLEKNIVSVEKCQASRIEQKVNLTEDYKEAQPSSQIVTELLRSDTPLDAASDNKSNPKGMMADLSFSINVSQQKTDDAFPQDRSADGNGSFPHTPEPKGKESVFKKDSKLTFESHLGRTGDKDVGSSSLLPPSPDHKATILPGFPSSPTRKALSGVHITLSPKRIELDLSGQLDAGTEIKQVGGVKNNLQPAALNAPSISSEATSQLKPNEPSSPKTQESSYFPTLASESQFKHPGVPVVGEQAPHRSQELLESLQNFPVQSNGRNLGAGGQSLEESSKTTAASQTERMSSDAITQITTESPEKTIYSAEIFVSTDNNEMDASRPLPQKRREILSTTTADVNQSSIFNRQADPPLLLPYKPPGSSEVYYVPCSKETLGLSRMRSGNTVESSHSGSNDAIPPKFPAQVLGSRDESPPDTVAVKHREGIYSKRTVAKGAWTEEKMSTREGFKESANIKKPLESVKATHSLFKPGEFYLHHPVPLQHEIDFLPRSDSLRQCSVQEPPAPSSKGFIQHKEMTERSQVPFSLHHRKREERFSPLTAELDYSFVEESRFNKPSETDSPRKESGQPDRRKTGHEIAKEPLSPGTQRTGLKEKQVADNPVMQSTYFTSSLDELWTKYLERQKQPLQRIADSNGRNELSLVERLDRLARLLQNPVRHSLVVPSKDEQSHVQKKAKRKEPKEMRSQGIVAYRSNLASHSKVEENPEIASSVQLSKSRFHNIGATTAIDLMDTAKGQDSETLSDASSEMRPVKDFSVLSGNTSESGVTQLETESAGRTEASGSVSTIDTARLIRAFGQDRVHISPKLSQLYSTISLQKTRSEKWAKGSRKSRTTDHPEMTRVVPGGKNTQATDSFLSSDSVSTASGSRGPSSALSSKRSARMLNKAVQAGDFEIVNSASKKHTRDVGQTFPTPISSHARIQRDHEGGMEDELSQSDRGSSESKGKQRRQPSGFLAEKRPRRSKSQFLQGVSWFVPAENLKSDPKKGNGSSNVPEPGPSWFEPLPSGKPWREPLREKNWQEDHSGLQVRLAAPTRDIENNPPSSLGKITLQEALALRRPDFISSSGERVKRLKLIIEERRLQSMLQGEREELFNPPEQRSYRNSAFLPNRDYRTIRRKRAISKNEMVQRSKRIYEQLPEVRKRREEEKRKSEYSTNRLKAQLYKTKITNRILGRKVPWE